MKSKTEASGIVYMIRHGEKDKEANGIDDKPGLNLRGQDRAQKLIGVFGKGENKEKWNIQAIFTCTPDSLDDPESGEARPYRTVLPLAQELGFDPHLVKRDHIDEVAEKIKKHASKGNVLVCWEHHRLALIAAALGVENAFPYPDKRFDLIWTIPMVETDLSITDVQSEHCKDLDIPVGGETWTGDGLVWTREANDGIGKEVWEFVPNAVDASNSEWKVTIGETTDIWKLAKKREKDKVEVWLDLSDPETKK